MSDTKQSSPIIIVQGGTKSSRYERQRAERRYRSEQARVHQDHLANVARTQNHQGMAGKFGMDESDTFGVSRLSTHSSNTRTTPRLLLQYMNRDHTVHQECISQLIELPNPAYPTNIELAFDMVCPRCLENGEEHGAAQMLIKQSHRMFDVDTGTAGTLVRAEMPDPDGNPIELVSAGQITCRDIIRCGNNCGFAARIAENKVWRV